ncbi:MAG: radical SAM protein [Oscillospiraceae bacterium]|nr:radical SAM protein [Oscillospiraceae bacterium]
MAPQTNFDLEAYLTESVEWALKSMLKAALFHPRESAFMAKYALASRTAAQRRHQLEEEGEHIPAFLIASITSLCNLHCVGCYARSVESCVDEVPEDQLSGEEWGRVFREARDAGVSFIFLAGGEPMVRRDVIAQAAQVPENLFPVITNGTLFQDEMLRLFDEHRNLIPLLSIEGGRAVTDARRGSGMYRKLREVMTELNRRGIAFGASITVTNQNLEEVTSDAFLEDLNGIGCKAVLYVEFVPTSDDVRPLTLNDDQRDWLAQRMEDIRSVRRDMVLLSFPGDEAASGGCLAAGRGFFHINSHGGAEPCPFSPYFDSSLRTMSLREALNSPLFRALRTDGILTEHHDGGCVLFDQAERVRSLMEQAQEA